MLGRTQWSTSLPGQLAPFKDSSLNQRDRALDSQTLSIFCEVHLAELFRTGKMSLFYCLGHGELTEISTNKSVLPSVL